MFCESAHRCIESGPCACLLRGLFVYCRWLLLTDIPLKVFSLFTHEAAGLTGFFVWALPINSSCLCSCSLCCPQVKKQRIPCAPYLLASWPRCSSVSSPTSACLLLWPWWCRITSWTGRVLYLRPSHMWAGLRPGTSWPWARSALCPPGKEGVNFLLWCAPLQQRKAFIMLI